MVIDAKYRVYPGSTPWSAGVVIGKRYHTLRPGYLPHGPVTTFWRRNAAWSTVAPNLVKTSYNQTFSRKDVMRVPGKKYRESHWPQVNTYQLAKFSGYGGYPLTYITRDNCVLCAKCATEQATRRDRDHWPRIVGVDVYYEGPAIACEGCGVDIESAYGDPNADELEG